MPVRKEVLSIARYSSIMMPDDDDDADLDPHVVEERRFTQVTPDFETVNKNASATPKKAITDPKEQENKNGPRHPRLMSRGGGGQSDELRELIQLRQNRMQRCTRCRLLRKLLLRSACWT